MADRFWVNDDADGLWNNANNWSATEAGAGGDGVPGVADAVIFANTVVDNCTVDANVSVASISNSAGEGIYTGIFNTSTFNVAVSGNTVWNGGTLSMGSGTWTLSGHLEIARSKALCKTSKIILDGAAGQTVTVDGNTLYMVEVTNASAAGVSFIDDCTIYHLSDVTVSTKITFQAECNYKITQLTLTGGSGTEITIVSSTAGTAYNLYIDGSQDVTYVNWTDCHTSGTPINCADGTSIDTSGNTNVDFANVNRGRGMSGESKMAQTWAINKGRR